MLGTSGPQHGIDPRPLGIAAAWFLAASLGLALSAASELIADKATKRFHNPECQQVQNIKSANRQAFSSESEARSRAFYPCTECMQLGEGETASKTKKKLGQPVTRETAYWGEPKTRLFHYAWCPTLKDEPPGRLIKFKQVELAVRQGYTPCRECGPPAFFDRTKPLLPEDLGGPQDVTGSAKLK